MRKDALPPDAADARWRPVISLDALDGALVPIKDLFDVAGADARGVEDPARGGASIRRRHGGAPPAARRRDHLRQDGDGRVRLLGLGLNPDDGTPGNAVDPERVPGGSSSGAGVAAGVGLGDVAIGSDPGGCVRIPAD